LSPVDEVEQIEAVEVVFVPIIQLEIGTSTLEKAMMID
jgi:hypothetical protein